MRRPSEEAPRPVAERPLRRDALANQERLLAAAVTAVLRDGRQVPMATIAAEAGVGVATLYRRYPTREALLDALTERSFLLVLSAAEDAAAGEGAAIASLDQFLERTIDHRDQLVLPLHGGPSGLSARSQPIRARVHAAITRLLQRGRDDGSIGQDVTTRDVVVFGAMLAQPLSSTRGWDRTARRQKAIFLAGVAANSPARSRAPTVKRTTPST